MSKLPITSRQTQLRHNVISESEEQVDARDHYDVYDVGRATRAAASTRGQFAAAEQVVLEALSAAIDNIFVGQAIRRVAYGSRSAGT